MCVIFAEKTDELDENGSTKTKLHSGYARNCGSYGGWFPLPHKPEWSVCSDKRLVIFSSSMALSV